MSGGLLWVSTALSTVRPATSPHLSTIKLDLVRQPNANGPVVVMITDTGKDLSKVPDEVSRIKREFMGVPDLTVLLDPAFGVVSDILDVWRHCYRAGDLSNTVNCFHSFFAD